MVRESFIDNENNHKTRTGFLNFSEVHVTFYKLFFSLHT